MPSFYVTRRALILGDRDAYTGWRSKTYTETSVQCVILPKGQSFQMGAAGYIAKYTNTGFSDDEWDEGDQLTDSLGITYEVESLQPIPWGDTFVFYILNLRQLTPYDPERKATASDWHTDSDGVTTDPRLRVISWINTYVDSQYINGEYAVIFAGADYPMSREFAVGELDGLYVVDAVDSQPVYTWNHVPYKFNEKVLIHIYTVSKTGQVAPLLLEQMEQELRHALTDHSLGDLNVKTSTSIKKEYLDVGATPLWHAVVELSYTRANHEFQPEFPVITYGSGSSSFVFPNCVKITAPNINNDVSMFSSTRMPTVWQALGSEGMEIQITCDLDCDTYYTWKRPQTSSTKTDKHNFQVFVDIMHGAQVDEEYQTLWVTNYFNFKVRLTRMEPSLDGSGNTVVLTFKEYSTTNMADTTYLARFGMS